MKIYSNASKQSDPTFALSKNDEFIIEIIELDTKQILSPEEEPKFYLNLELIIVIFYDPEPYIAPPISLFRF